MMRIPRLLIVNSPPYDPLTTQTPSPTQSSCALVINVSNVSKSLNLRGTAIIEQFKQISQLLMVSASEAITLSSTEENYCMSECAYLR